MVSLGHFGLLFLAFAAAALAQRPVSTEEPLLRGTVAFELSDRELIPEGMAFDPVSRSFFVGSLYKRKILRIAPDGRESDFVASAGDGIWGVLGMKVDAGRRALWANACNATDDSIPMMPDDPDTRGQGGLFHYDLETGRLVAKYVAGWRESPRCFNDLVVAVDGSVYLTAGVDGVYVARNGGRRLELLTEHASFLNGIAISEDQTRLFLGDIMGVQVMPLDTLKATPLAVPEGVTLAGIDGLYVRGRTLVGIQNGLRDRVARVIQAELSPALDAVECFTVLERGRPDYDIPTTGALVGGEIFYIAASQMRRFSDKRIFPWNRLKETPIVRTPLEIPCRGGR